MLERKPRFLYTPPPLQSRPWPNEQWAQPAIGNPNVGIQPINDHVSLGTAARHQLARVIVGQEELIDQLMVGLISNGHILLEGLAKNARAQDARLRDRSPSSSDCRPRPGQNLVSSKSDRSIGALQRKFDARHCRASCLFLPGQPRHWRQSDDGAANRIVKRISSRHGCPLWPVTVPLDLSRC